MTEWEQIAENAIGKTVRNKKAQAKVYKVSRRTGDKVYLEAQGQGARSTWKWASHLWLDYEQV